MPKDFYLELPDETAAICKELLRRAEAIKFAGIMSPQRRLPFLQSKMVGGADKATFKRGGLPPKWGNIPPPQPHDVTAIAAAHKTPEAATASGVFYAIFQGENKKMHLPLFAKGAGNEQ